LSEAKYLRKKQEKKCAHTKMKIAKEEDNNDNHQRSLPRDENKRHLVKKSM